MDARCDQFRESHRSHPITRQRASHKNAGTFIKSHSDFIDTDRDDRRAGTRCRHVCDRNLVPQLSGLHRSEQNRVVRTCRIHHHRGRSSSNRQPMPCRRHRHQIINTLSRTHRNALRTLGSSSIRIHQPKGKAQGRTLGQRSHRHHIHPAPRNPVTVNPTIRRHRHLPRLQLPRRQSQVHPRKAHIPIIDHDVVKPPS